MMFIYDNHVMTKQGHTSINIYTHTTRSFQFPTTKPVHKALVDPVLIAEKTLAKGIT